MAGSMTRRRSPTHSSRPDRPLSPPRSSAPVWPPEVRVGILADNSVDYAATYLAIPRVGMVSVPLNTRQPSDNLTFVAEDAAMALVIHDDANAGRLPVGRSLDPVRLRGLVRLRRQRGATAR